MYMNKKKYFVFFKNGFARGCRSGLPPRTPLKTCRSCNSLKAGVPLQSEAAFNRFLNKRAIFFMFFIYFT